MAKKFVRVEDILKLMCDEDEVYVSFYAYGMSYAQSWVDGFKTVKECKDNFKYDCKRAMVVCIEEARSHKGESMNAIHIKAEMVC